MKPQYRQQKSGLPTILIGIGLFLFLAAFWVPASEQCDEVSIEAQPMPKKSDGSNEEYVQAAQRVADIEAEAENDRAAANADLAIKRIAEGRK